MRFTTVHRPARPTEIVRVGFSVAVSLPSCQKTTEKPAAQDPPAKTAPPPTPSAADPIDQNRSGTLTIRSGSPVIQAEMSSEFLEAFRESKECRGIRILAKGEETKP